VTASAVYAAARAYAVAFSYRDVPAEVDKILSWASATSGRRPRSALELAAGPADHAIELARRGLRTCALDLSPQMSRYSATVAARLDVELTTITADMRTFAIGDTFDLALTMIDSIAHLLTAADLDAHFRAVGAHLAPGGCYVVEFSHEADSPGDEGLTKASWTQRLGDEQATISWGDPTTDSYDERTGVAQVHVSIDYQAADSPVVHIRDLMPMRTWRPADVEASLQRVADFDVTHRFGSFEGGPLDAADAWRTILVLRRCPDTAQRSGLSP
jgi:hypothetical protein